VDQNLHDRARRRQPDAEWFGVAEWGERSDGERVAVSGVVRAELVGVGTELLLGQIANTNARWMGERLAEIGVDVLYHQVVGDNAGRIESVLRLAASRADVVLVTGGLGPTEDDITRDVIALILDVPMVRRSEIEKYLRDRFAGFGRGQMPENNLRQADVPEGVRYIMPALGTAPGLIAELPEGATIYAVPGVPGEMVEMMESTILPELRARVGAAALVSRTLRCVGIGESRVAEILADLFEASSNPSIAYLASAGEVKVRLTAKAATAEEAETMIAPLAAEVTERLGDVVFTTRDETLEQTVLRRLQVAGLSLACAESLTGGSVGARLTSVPGASVSFVGSAVVYTAEAKHQILGVSRETLDGPGVVSEACALEMAAGARRLYDADVALALTGAAGPEPHGGAEPGTVWLALEDDQGRHARGYVATGDRERVRRWAEQAALDLVRRHLEGLPLPDSDRIN
jgi:nicotinamide-nucleotide amidase